MTRKPAERTKARKRTRASPGASGNLPFIDDASLPVALRAFHPAVAAWFAQSFAAPTPAQLAAWPAIASGRHALIAAPTGSGKTLAAFLAAIDALVREGAAAGGVLPNATSIVYVSPLKALSNDIAINLEAPLAGIGEQLFAMGLPALRIRTAVRTGDTPQGERSAMRKLPPHILVTTPESLYVLLGSDSGRAGLAGVRTVIVDEIHAVVGNKRGSHLALTLERLEALCGKPLLRIGLSATQRPIDEVARFLVGAGRRDDAMGDAAHAPVGDAAGTPNGRRAMDGIPQDAAEAPDCAIVDVGHVRERDLAIEVPPVPLGAVLSNEAWELVYTRISDLVQQHRTTLVFVNTRRMAERVARHLSERLGKEAVAAHHGSMARELRLDAEQRLKRGDLRVLVATASLELGIDIGDVELVCQLGSPRSIAAFLQRVGRSGHAVGGMPKGRLFPSSRDDLVECAALLDCVRRGELDLLRMPPAPLDVLAQQIVAEVGSREWDEDALHETFRRAWPYAQLARKDYAEVVRMLAEGYSSRRGARTGLIHRDAVNRRLRGNAGGRLTALTSGGTIPDTADYAVVLEPAAQNIGSVNEDFAIESIAGDIFQLGNASYRILRIERGKLRVEDAHGLPPTIPFWLGEAPGRSDALSLGVSRLREEIARRLQDPTARWHESPLLPGEAGARSAAGAGMPSVPELDAALGWLTQEVGLTDSAAAQIADYLAGALAAFGMLPTRKTLAMERFFDESGGTQLVIHSPCGSRINKAWGLALRKRFCRSFNFELQAAATEDAIVLSLSTSHSFPLADVARFLHSSTAQDVLVQALLDAPLFPTRWRWNATTALALPRFSGGAKTAPQIQRMRSEDLLATVFPDQVACLENIVGERQIPDHPLVAQTLYDCLHEAMDVDGFLDVLRGLESGEIGIVARDLVAPSPLAAEILTAKPHAFLDDAPLEERRTQAVQNRRYADPQSPDDLGQLDASAIAAVREEAWPQARNADEMHEALMGLGIVTAAEASAHASWRGWLASLAHDRRATNAGCEGASFWIAAERLPQLQAVHPHASIDPPIEAPAEYAQAAWTSEDALVDLLRARLTGLGPTTATDLAASFALKPSAIEAALIRLEVEGYAMRGRFTAVQTVDDPAHGNHGLGAAEAAARGHEHEWCERHLLARIHRYTIGRLRREIEPVAPRDWLRFACEWQHVTQSTRLRGPDALASVLAQLEGYEAPAGAWESDLLAARIADYDPAWLDALCQSGRIVWLRLRASAPAGDASPSRAGPVRATPIVLLPRRERAAWAALVSSVPLDAHALSSRARKLVEHLRAGGASFFDEMGDATGLLETELEEALGELVAQGCVNADSYIGLRALLVPASKRPRPGAPRRTRRGLLGIADAGRWALIRNGGDTHNDRDEGERHEHVARTLLRRYGVVCWQMLDREAAWLPRWRDLLRVFHRLEARGEIRGGRFIAGLSGEQFALPEAIGLLRQVRQRAHDGALVCIGGADPLNVVGSVIAGARVPAVATSRIVFRDGVPIATQVAGDIALHAVLSPAEEAQARDILRRRPAFSVLPAAHLAAPPA
ncbi:MAG: DEAD/DEAH box helicase [Proteobacteria bacterium]|nr:DEAD/DEAH box helicase [Pseudomonadota bacterium]